MHAVWTANGRELLVNASNQRMVVYSFALAPRVVYGSVAEIDRSSILAIAQGPRQFDVTADGMRILAMTSAANDAAPTREIRVVQNWFQELKK